MTPEALHQRLVDLAAEHPSPSLPEGRDALDPAWREGLEARAAAHPSDQGLRRLLLDLHQLTGATDGLPPVVAGVRWERLVRASSWSVTVAGIRTSTGEPALVRTLRAAYRRDPVLRRQLLRDGELLAPALPGLALDRDVGAVVVTARGPALVEEGRGTARDTWALGALMLRTLAAWHAREVAGAGLPVPGPAELRDEGDRLALLTLDPEPHLPRAALAQLAEAFLRLAPDAEAPLALHLAGWRVAPPASAAEAGEQVVGWLAELLAATRHGLVRGRVAGREARKRERLVRVLARLDAAVPPPVGRGAMGVDLDGHVILAVSTSTCIQWGTPPAELVDLWDPEDGLDVPSARRLVRVQGSAPPSARLEAEHGGASGFSARLARWLSASLELRALRRLLDLADAS